jgi:hypothetical protein
MICIRIAVVAPLACDREVGLQKLALPFENTQR